MDRKAAFQKADGSFGAHQADGKAPVDNMVNLCKEILYSLLD
jgi:hypothetical protein